MAVRQIDLYMILADLRIDPYVYFFGLVEKDHVFIDYEVTVMIGKTNAGTDDGFSVAVCFLGVVILLQFYNRFVL